jgi:hypothetical protein
MEVVVPKQRKTQTMVKVLVNRLSLVRSHFPWSG